MKTSRLLYIFQAALEYLISLAVTSSFLAKITSELGMSDSLIGIVSAITSLGGMFQILSMLLRHTRAKKFVVTLSVLNQLLFIFLYFIPRLALGQKMSTVLFVATILSAYLLYNIAGPAKNSWLMGLVPDNRRGVFTAYKEMFSLLMGMAFSFGMGALFDWLEGMGKLQTAFGVMSAVMVVCMLLATLCLVFIQEQPTQMVRRKPFFQTLRQVLGNRKLAAVAVLYIIYFVLCNASTPFYGTYQLNELGFSLTLISGLGIVSSLARMLVSTYWGRYADRYSFNKMVQRCLLLLGASHLCAALATPANGVVMFGLYYVLHGIAMGGVNSAMFNLVFDYAPQEMRADALAICQTVAGATGFLATLLFSAVVSAIQQNGNQVLGMTVYAQQLLSLVSVLCALGAIGFIQVFLRKKA